ncbi:MAG: hypothetical protein LH613_15105 [Chamaesiphon sp.]|nr:hypothetical protein [Chamaesiphon sp.]
MQKINGVYLGWIPPQQEQWEPLFRTIRIPGGFDSEPTRLYAANLERYPGLELALSFHPDPSKLPFALSHRTPLVREDYERNARTLNLSYPNLDLFEYIGRTGGFFSGDSFTVCPIVSPNDDNNYSYESGLRKINSEVANHLNRTSKLKAIASSLGQPTLVTADDRVLGELLPHFTIIKDAVFNIQLANIGEKHYFGGGQVIISFDTNINLYDDPCFALASRGATVNV